MAAAHVVEGHSRCSNKGVKSVDVYETPARIILFSGAEACAGNGPSLTLYTARTPLEQALFGEYIYLNIKK